MKLDRLHLTEPAVLLLSLLLVQCTNSLPSNQNSKFLGNELQDERSLLDRRRRPQNQGPCNFGGSGKPKNQPTGRFFFDLQYFNVEHNYNYNINCGGGGYPGNTGVLSEHNKPGKPILGGNKPFQGGHKPMLGSHHKPHKPGHNNGGGFFENRPILSGFLFGNRPQGSSEAFQGPGQQGVYSGSFAGILPTPQQFGQGLGEGIQSFLETIPQIGQSFQSLLPSFDNFHLPQLPSGPLQFPAFQQGGPVTENNFNRPQSISTGIQPTRPPIVSTPTTPIDPDDIIYNDEIKPVHEDYDAVTDLYNKLPPGNRREPKYRAGNQNSLRYYREYDQQEISARSNGVSARDRKGSSNFKFPSR